MNQSEFEAVASCAQPAERAGKRARASCHCLFLVGCIEKVAWRLLAKRAEQAKTKLKQTIIFLTFSWKLLEGRQAKLCNMFFFLFSLGFKQHKRWYDGHGSRVWRDRQIQVPDHHQQNAIKSAMNLLSWYTFIYLCFRDPKTLGPQNLEFLPWSLESDLFTAWSPYHFCLDPYSKCYRALEPRENNPLALPF